MANSIFLNPFGTWSFDGTTTTIPNAVSVTGAITATGNLTLTAGNLFVPASGLINATNRFFFRGGSSNGLLEMSDNGGTLGVGFDVTTDALLKLRTRTQGAYATLDCLGLKASGTAGANFGPSPVASLTIVNGIVTVAS